MSIALAVVAIEAVEALLDRGTGGIAGPESPLPESSGAVSSFLKNLCDGYGPGGDGPLAGKLATVFGITIVPDFGMAEVASRKKHTTGRGTDRRSGVVVGETDSLGGEAVDVWSFDFLLAVAAKFAVAEVVGQDKDDVGLFLGS